MGRYEIKYRISSSTRNALRAEIASRLQPDRHGLKGAYDVHSVYLDSSDLNRYHEKIDGIFSRHKIRMRYYGTHSPYFLEIKERINTQIHKHRAILSPQQRETILQGRPMFGSESLSAVQKYNRAAQSSILRPKVLVSYAREAYSAPLLGNLRVTFDSHITARMFSGLHRPAMAYTVMHRQWIVLEIKFEHMMTAWLEDLIKRHKLVPESVSKYCLSVIRVGRLGRMEQAAC